VARRGNGSAGRDRRQNRAQSIHWRPSFFFVSSSALMAPGGSSSHGLPSVLAFPMINRLRTKPLTSMTLANVDSSFKQPACDPGIWLLDPGSFLNHGSFGSCPRAVLEFQQELRERLERRPVQFLVRELEGLWDQARHALASFVGAIPTNWFFVPNATSGVNTVLRSLQFEPWHECTLRTLKFSAAERTAASGRSNWRERKTVFTPLVALGTKTSSSGLLRRRRRARDAPGPQAFEFADEELHGPSLQPLAQFLLEFEHGPRATAKRAVVEKEDPGIEQPDSRIASRLLEGGVNIRQCHGRERASFGAVDHRKR